MGYSGRREIKYGLSITENATNPHNLADAKKIDIWI
jgi:hypothetical protein